MPLRGFPDDGEGIFNRKGSEDYEATIIGDAVSGHLRTRYGSIPQRENRFRLHASLDLV
jgi:hypothetical protein